MRLCAPLPSALRPGAVPLPWSVQPHLVVAVRFVAHPGFVPTGLVVLRGLAVVHVDWKRCRSQVYPGLETVELGQILDALSEEAPAAGWCHVAEMGAREWLGRGEWALLRRGEVLCRGLAMALQPQLTAICLLPSEGLPDRLRTRP